MSTCLDASFYTFDINSRIGCNNNISTYKKAFYSCLL